MQPERVTNTESCDATGVFVVNPAPVTFPTETRPHTLYTSHDVVLAARPGTSAHLKLRGRALEQRPAAARIGFEPSVASAAAAAAAAVNGSGSSGKRKQQQPQQQPQQPQSSSALFAANGRAAGPECGGRWLVVH